MASGNPLTWWRGFLALPNTHPLKTVGVAFLVALGCSLVVSIVSVKLKPLQEANRLRERAAIMMGLLEELGVGPPEEHLVELASGAYVYRDPGTETDLPAERDAAGLGSRKDVAAIYEVRQDGVLKLVVLPVRGSGYQSILEGYLALREDLKTIAALRFHRHDETPGLGAGIEETDWQALWPGKLVSDAQGTVRIKVARGEGKGPHEVDAISGATRTGTGVTDLLHFWLGPDGYGPYLARLKEEGNR